MNNEQVKEERATQEEAAAEELRQERKIRCLVWDLDNTMWNGIFLEDERVILRDGVIDVIHALDSRGVLQSIASRNDHSQVMAQLEAFGLHEYFIYPQINWGTKSASLEKIARAININIGTLAFIDDQPFELEEVAFSHPGVLCINAAELNNLLDMPEMMPRFITEDSKYRRKMYQADIVRQKMEERFEGPQDSFLASLEMQLTIKPAEASDLERAEELTIRTNQLNTTGRTYSYQELDEFRKSDRYHLWVACLDDKYGTYGRIGLALIDKGDDEWWIRLLLMSCRVINRGVGTVFINHIRNRARDAGVRLMAEMVLNDRNRMMYMTYRFNHFREKEQRDRLVIFENDLSKKQAFPAYMKLTCV
jgi:FkbH-like protein